MTPLQLHSATAERRSLEAENAALKAAQQDAANRLDAVYADLIITPTISARTIDEIAKIKTKLRNGR